MLLPVLGRDDTDRRVMINTIGPVWDGNEVWLLVAGGATFAAFPEWYATLFSGFYLALLLILVALIVRGVAFEYRGKRDAPRWRRWLGPGDLRRLRAARAAVGRRVRQHRARRPDRPDHEFTGNFFTLLNPYALLGGLTTLALFTLHGPSSSRSAPRARWSSAPATPRASSRSPPQCWCSGSSPGRTQTRSRGTTGASSPG